MGQLIDGLLAFSGLSRQTMNKRAVEPRTIVQRVLHELQSDLSGRRVEISTGDLPACEADPTLLQQVYANLISNALKYTRDRDPAVIAIGCRQQNGEQAYFVKDNGAGFDMKYAGKLFGVFQRLHRAEEFEGTGVGLAIVQRIVHRHGGRVWAEAEPEKGATFYFTLWERKTYG
jgi:light-regulated signal transduction histidine kinase (bacteriophytochrome)